MDPAAAVVVDARGLLCPLPVARLRRAAARAAPGDEIVLLADDPLARLDVAAWCSSSGHELLGVDAEAGLSGRTELRFRVLIGEIGER